MQTDNIIGSLTTLFSELVDGAKAPVGGNFVLNSGDPGLLASLDKLSAADASRSVDHPGLDATRRQSIDSALAELTKRSGEVRDSLFAAFF